MKFKKPTSNSQFPRAPKPVSLSTPKSAVPSGKHALAARRWKQQRLHAVDLGDKAKNLKDLVEEITYALENAEDNQQQMQLDLQNKLQQVQQTTQMLSNVLKSMHDSAKSILQNLR